MQATGYIRLKRGIWQIVIDYLDENGQRHQTSVSTGLPEKGNKRRAQQMLNERLEELSQQYTATLTSRNILFLTFMQDWLNDIVSYKVKSAPFPSISMYSTITSRNTNPSMASNSRNSPQPCCKATIMLS